ncbi:uncharacterized protein NEMAJ01_0057 [Nematocida major]|uniref:uncharacterized protein n=1 Tax=Nematocida major TaxID=1912982 RepID=UPI002007E669|nr:uncharacterized protein NEMAJ01_0057 [Nematocida major]KAH9385161.1 hypothetical protein NEMAJ01_0057 [Nematocida major]
MKEANESEEKRKTEGQKPTEGSAVIQMQNEAVDKLKSVTTRRYKKTTLLVRTLGGSLLEMNGWASEEKAHTKPEKTKPGHVCAICNKSFADKRKLSAHKSVHEKAPGE